MNQQIIEAETRELIQLPSRDTARLQLERVRDFQRTVRELFVEGHDFGIIPGTGDKPTLLKPGAEKLIKLLCLADTYEFLDKVEVWEQGFFNYTIKCSLRNMDTGQIVAEGLGNCNSWESKYRWRWAWPNEISESDRVGKKTRSINTKNGRQTQYRVENDDVASLVNTILKMAKKRAQMDAALSAGRLSDVFTQDVEEIVENRRAAGTMATPPEDTPEAPARTEPVPSAVRERVVPTEQSELLLRHSALIRAAVAKGMDTARWELPDEVKESELEPIIADLAAALNAAPRAAPVPASVPA